MTSLSVKTPVLIFLFSLAMNPVHASQDEVNEIVFKMLQTIYSGKKTSFHAGLKVCDLGDDECIRNPAEEYDRKVRIYLSEIDPEQNKDHSTLVKIYFPERQQKAILHGGGKLYLLLSTTKTPIRIPPQQSLLGDADVGAVLDINYLVYEARELERYDDTIKIEFTNPTKKQQFSKIILHISLSSYTPIEGDFYSNTGKLIRHAEYLNVGELGDRVTFRRTLVDSLVTKNNSVTLIDYIAEEGVLVPEKLFRKNKIADFRSKY